MAKWPTGYVTAGVLKERGWTESLIKRFMPEPCMTIPNRVYRSAPPYRLYREGRVADVEATGLWQQAASVARDRGARAKRATETKREALLETIRRLEIKVPQIERDELIERACDSYNSHKLGLYLERGYEYTPASKDSNPQFLERLMVNYLRHEMTDYERLLARTYGRVGVRAAYYEIAKKVYDAIARAYPDLFDECDRQLKKRGKLNGG